MVTERTLARCPACRGLGHQSIRCVSCAGTGLERCGECAGRGWSAAGWDAAACPACDGSGRRRCELCSGRGFHWDPCAECAGTGSIPLSQADAAARRPDPPAWQQAQE